MATTTHPQSAGVQLIDIDQITLPANVRELDAEHVENLAASIALRGLRVPVIVCPAGDGYELIAGFHRLAAHRALGNAQIRADVQSDTAAAVDRGLENIARKQLRPDEEAEALRAMLADGLTPEGAAQALAWSKAKATARMRLLELPETARAMIGRGEISLSAVEELRTIQQASPELLTVLIDYAAQDEQAAGLLGHDTARVLPYALRETGSPLFAAWLTQMRRGEAHALRLGKKAEQAYQRADALTKQLDRYAYGPVIRFAEADVDQARAAHALLELPGGAPIVVDRGVYRESCKQAIHRTVDELEAQLTEHVQQQKARRGDPSTTDPHQQARLEQQRQLRELAARAHGVNLDVGAGLLKGLSTVEPTDMTVARFFAYALLGSDHDGSPYTQSGARVAHLAMNGIRLVIGEFRTETTHTLKSGKPGKTRVTYGDACDPATAIAWLWKYIDAAKTAGELYGRTLVVIAAERYASRLVIAQSQRGPQLPWNSHHDRADKALTKLAGPHLPASLKALEKAIADAHRSATTPRSDASTDSA